MIATKQISSFFTELVYSPKYKHSSLFVNNSWRLKVEKGGISEVDFGYFIPDLHENKIEENISRYFDNITFFNEYLPDIINKFSNFNFEIDLEFNQMGLLEKDMFQIRAITHFIEKDFMSINTFFNQLQNDHPNLFDPKNTLQILCRNKQFFSMKISYLYNPKHEVQKLPRFIMANNNQQVGVMYNKARAIGNCDFLLDINKEGQIHCYKIKQLVRTKKGVVV